MPAAEPQPISDHFWPALFFVEGYFRGIRAAKHEQHPILALHPKVARVGSSCPGPEGLSTGCLKRGEGTSCWVMALRRLYLCPKTRSESKAAPGEFITGQWIIPEARSSVRQRSSSGKGSTQTLQSSTATAGMQVRLSTLKTSPEEQNRYHVQAFQYPITTDTGTYRPVHVEEPRYGLSFVLRCIRGMCYVCSPGKV